MYVFIVAQVLSLVAGIFMLLSTHSGQDKLLKFQTFDCIANILADVLLGGWVGAVLCMGGLIRNNLELLEQRAGRRVSLWVINGAVWILSALVSIFGGSGFLIIIAEIGYTAAVLKLDGIKLQVALSIDLACWLFYDVSIRSFPMAAVDAVILMQTLVFAARQADDRNVVKIGVREESAADTDRDSNN